MWVQNRTHLVNKISDDKFVYKKYDYKIEDIKFIML